MKIIKDSVTFIDEVDQFIYLKYSEKIRYDKVCICTGVKPQLLVRNHPNIIGIRDVSSVHKLTEKLSVAKKVAVVGNGGIALEIIHEV